MATKPSKRQRRSFGKLRRLPSGRWQASYLDPRGSGRRYLAPHTYDAKIDAEAFLAAESRLIQLGQWAPPEQREQARAAQLITLREYASQWVAERDLAPKTRFLYQSLLDSRILPILGDEQLSNITPSLIRTWWAGLGRATPTRSAHSYSLLRTILNTAVADRIIAENPCQIKGAGRPPKRRELELLTLDELQYVTERMPERYRVAVPVAAWSGLRFGELIELRRKDVVSTADGATVLKIRRAATIVDDTLVVGPPKTEAGIRDVHVPPHVGEVLAQHMQRWTGPGPEAFVFTTNAGKRLSASAFTKAFKSALPEGKKNVRVHDLRHLGAVLAARAGATTKELMARLGHTTPEMALRYQHAAAERDRQIAERLSKLAEGE